MESTIYEDDVTTDGVDTARELSEECLEKLTDLEKKFANILVFQRPKNNSEALKRAGSKAQGRNLTKLAWQMQQRPHVQEYIEYLRSIMKEETGLELQEVIHNARKAIEMAFAMGKPKDAEPHNRLLAELGGFIKNTPTNAVQNNIKIEDASLKGDSLASDIKRLRNIAGMLTEP